MQNGIVILSGGVDSSTLAYKLVNDGLHIETLTFDYNQRHRKEIISAVHIAESLDVRNDVIDIVQVGSKLKNSALTDNVGVPHGHYHSENMRKTVVPNRNAIMLSIAWGVAVSRVFDFVSYAAHSGDHYIYPDCRPSFCNALELALREATFPNKVELYTPFLVMSKMEIIKLGLSLKVPYDITWTCYEGGDIPCGKCGSCIERQEAFDSVQNFRKT
jgi:7-cyano-7-deazaguanine synthase